MQYIKYVYLLIVLGLAGGGYYEINKQAEEIKKDKLEKYNLQVQKSGLDKDIADLGTQKDGLVKVLGDNQGKETKLNSDIADQQKLIDQAKADTQTANDAATTARDGEDKAKKHTDYILHPPPPTNNLGTIVTVDRKTYENCNLLKVEPDGITINSSKGVVKINYPFLPMEVQAKFGYDSSKPGELSASQVAYQEAIRVEAGD